MEIQLERLYIGVVFANRILPTLHLLNISANIVLIFCSKCVSLPHSEASFSFRNQRNQRKNRRSVLDFTSSPAEWKERAMAAVINKAENQKGTLNLQFRSKHIRNSKDQPAALTLVNYNQDGNTQTRTVCICKCICCLLPSVWYTWCVLYICISFGFLCQANHRTRVLLISGKCAEGKASWISSCFFLFGRHAKSVPREQSGDLISSLEYNFQG